MYLKVSRLSADSSFTFKCLQLNKNNICTRIYCINVVFKLDQTSCDIVIQLLNYHVADSDPV